MSYTIQLLVAALLLVSLSAEPFVFSTTNDFNPTVIQSIRDKELTTLNIYRGMHGVPALELDEILNTQAQTHV